MINLSKKIKKEYFYKNIFLHIEHKIKKLKYKFVILINIYKFISIMTCNNKKTCIEIIDKQLLENQENINQTSFQLDTVQAQMKELEEYLNSL